MMANDDALRVAALWNENADQWSRHLRDGRDVYRELFTFPAMQAALPDIRGMKLVDFGCGEGTNTRQFAYMGAQMTGIDLSERMIAIASDAQTAELQNIAYHVASYCTDTGLPAAEFDGVVSTMALMDGPDIGGTMQEAYRLVRPGGFLAFSVLHPCFFTQGMKWLSNHERKVQALRVAGYFRDEPYSQVLPGISRRATQEGKRAVRVTRYPRTIGDYCNAVIAAGFRIVRIDEPRPSPEVCAKIPSMAIWREIAAFMLVIYAERDS